MSLSGHPPHSITRCARTLIPARTARHFSSHGRSKRWLDEPLPYFGVWLEAGATKDDGAALFQAASSAGRRTATVAARSFTFVAPLSPQPPLTGVNTVGCARTNDRCWAGVNFTIAQATSGYARVENIFFLTRKSGWPRCENSQASGRLSASFRKVVGVIARFNLGRISWLV